MASLSCLCDGDKSALVRSAEEKESEHSPGASGAPLNEGNCADRAAAPPLRVHSASRSSSSQSSLPVFSSSPSVVPSFFPVAEICVVVGSTVVVVVTAGEVGCAVKVSGVSTGYECTRTGLSNGELSSPPLPLLTVTKKGLSRALAEAAAAVAVK